MSRPEPAGWVVLSHGSAEPRTQQSPSLRPGQGSPCARTAPELAGRGRKRRSNQSPQTTAGEEMEGVTFG